jgi:hypothetical protein
VSIFLAYNELQVIGRTMAGFNQQLIRHSVGWQGTSPVPQQAKQLLYLSRYDGSMWDEMTVYFDAKPFPLLSGSR